MNAPHKKGLGFSFFVFLCPLLVKSGSGKTTFNSTRFLPSGALKSKWHISYLGFYKTIHRLRFWKIEIRYVFRSVYLRNGFDKLFGYQYHLLAILVERL